MASQLRIYDITPGRLEEFAAKVTDEILPLRLAHGFTYDGPWLVRETNQFAWIVHYRGEGSFEEAVDRYYNDPARSAISFDPGDYITRSDTRMMDAFSR